jgi:hypothetical protein
VLQFSAYKRTFDNITTVMIAFENFENIAGTSTQSSKLIADPATIQQTAQQTSSLHHNPYALMHEFSSIYEDVSGPPQEPTVVEEELIDN